MRLSPIQTQTRLERIMHHRKSQKVTRCFCPVARKVVFLAALILLVIEAPTVVVAWQQTQNTESTEVTRTTEEAAENLWNAARTGDLEKVRTTIENGCDVNSKTEYGATALSFACDRGHLKVVEYLLEQGADPNVRDSFYNSRPIDWATMKKHTQIARALAMAGASGVDSLVSQAINDEDIPFLKAVLDKGGVRRQTMLAGLKLAESKEAPELVAAIKDAIERQFPKIDIPESTIESYCGNYVSDQGAEIEITKMDQKLKVQLAENRVLVLELDRLGQFSNAANVLKFQFAAGEDSLVTGCVIEQSRQETRYRKLTAKESKAMSELASASNEKKEREATRESKEFSPSTRESRESRLADLAVSSGNWGQFRGNQARGIADGQNPPREWDAESEQNLIWKATIPGLGLSCPVVWEDKVYVTTAISEKDLEIKTGLYGDVTSVDDDSVHEFVTICFDANSGDELWRKTACKTVPSIKRHLKSTHANSTVATDGKHVVAWFGSEGIYCYSMAGDLIWEKSLGLLDSGWFYDREYQWQFAASPIIFDGRLILQCDIQDQSFLATYDVATGEEIWKVDREEIPSWSTPTVVETPTGYQIITNATKAIRSNDLETGTELWRIENNSEIAVPTPFLARDLIFVTSGYRPVRPIYAVRLNATGQLVRGKEQPGAEFLAWSQSSGGPYMPTPIVYGDYLYICGNSGVMTCQVATTGEDVYKKRLKMEGLTSFVGSLVAADGYLYITSEDGETAVIQAGPDFEIVSRGYIRENCLTTPAISNGKIFLRGQKHLFAFGSQQGS